MANVLLRSGFRALVSKGVAEFKVTPAFTAACLEKDYNCNRPRAQYQVSFCTVYYIFAQEKFITTGYKRINPRILLNILIKFQLTVCTC